MKELTAIMQNGGLDDTVFVLCYSLPQRQERIVIKRLQMSEAPTRGIL